MSALQNLLNKHSKQQVAVAPAVDDQFVEKLASACEYAAEQLAGKVFADNKGLPSHSYQHTATPQEKVASVAPNSIASRILKEKVAKNTAVVAEDAVQSSRGIVANLLARFSAHVPEAEVTTHSRVEIEVPMTSPETESVDAVAANEGTRLSDVLEAAQSANGTRESTAVSGSTKTAGVQGKGPMAVGAATNRLRERLLSQAGGKK